MAMGGLPAADLPPLRSRMSDEEIGLWLTAVQSSTYNKTDDDPRMNTEKFGRPYPARDRSPKALAINLCWAICEARCGLAQANGIGRPLCRRFGTCSCGTKLKSDSCAPARLTPARSAAPFSDITLRDAGAQVCRGEPERVHPHRLQQPRERQLHLHRAAALLRQGDQGDQGALVLDAGRADRRREDQGLPFLPARRPPGRGPLRAAEQGQRPAGGPRADARRRPPAPRGRDAGGQADHPAPLGDSGAQNPSSPSDGSWLGC